VEVLLAGCGGQSHPNLPAGAERVALSDFPVGIGSGYPLGFLVQGGEAPRLGESPPDFAMWPGAIDRHVIDQMMAVTLQ